MAIYFTVDLDKLAARCLYLDRIENTVGRRQVITRIQAFRDELSAHASPARFPTDPTPRPAGRACPPPSILLMDSPTAIAASAKPGQPRRLLDICIERAVARAAVSMRSATGPGCETATAWEAAISTVVDPARSARKRCRSGGMPWSWVVIMVQEGIVFQAALVTLSSWALAEAGRCVAAMISAVPGSTSAANTSGNLSCRMY